jgi:hypothetical protein
MSANAAQRAREAPDTIYRTESRIQQLGVGFTVITRIRRDAFADEARE